MAARARDESRNANTIKKDKENRPPSPPKIRQSLIPSLVRSPERLEFFTDSYLGNSDVSLNSAPPSSASKLPTLRTKNGQRRFEKDADEGLIRPKHRNVQSESHIPRPKEIRIIHKRQTTGTGSARSLGLSTPPRSREGDSVASPLSNFSSPPRALTDTYERILQEEDLAATEGEISDPESLPGHFDRPVALQQHVDTSEHRVPLASSPLSPSRATTPTQQSRQDRDQALDKNDELTTASIRSDPTGTSFWQDLSDRRLAEAMTPLAIQSANERQALKAVWAQKRLQAFSRAGSVNATARNLDAPDLASLVPSQRLRAFSKAHRIKLDSDYLMRPSHQRTFSDVAQQVTRSQDDQAVPTARSNWHNEDVTRDVMPHNPRLHKPPHFSRVHGFPERSGVLQYEDGVVLARPHGESPSMHNAGLATPLESRPQRSDSEHGPAPQSDWNNAARREDVLQKDDQLLSDHKHWEETPQRSRRFDVDFTGQSFQVSDSPSVQVKSSPHEYLKRREIDVVAKQAVTTSRLSQIRARESVEALRRLSGSLSEEPNIFHESAATQGEAPRTNNGQSSNASTVSDKPLSSETHKSPSVSKANSSSGYNDSHQLLQRLARGSTGSPSASSYATRCEDGEVDEPRLGREHRRVSSTATGPASSERNTQDPNMRTEAHAHIPPVQETPRPAGAWTDTVLPDTVKMPHRKPRTLHTQTPHVHAGGWVETPAAKSQIWGLDSVPEATTEIPRDLMAGIARERIIGAPSQGHSKIEQHAVKGMAVAEDVVEGQVEKATVIEARSIAQKVLKDIEEKNACTAASGVVQSTTDDTLQLNPSTLQSIQNVLDTNTEDLTSLSRLGADIGSPHPDDTINTVTSLSDTQLLSRLSAKIDKVMTTMQDARRGISHLVEQVASSESIETAGDKLQITNAKHPQLTASTAQGNTAINNSPTAMVQAPTMVPPAALYTVFPVGLAVLSLPVPLLWRSAQKDLQQRFARPTVLGWALIGLWSWYVLETVLSEVYSHPLHAFSYTWPDQSEPEFPFVLPTMLWRWSRLAILYPYTIQPIVDIVTATFKMLAMVTGLTDGFVDQPVSLTHHVVSEAASTAVREAASMIPDVNMNLMNDEFV